MDKMSTKSLIFKYGGLFLIILAFGGIIIGISRVFAKSASCDAPNVWASGPNKCLKKCSGDLQYNKDWKCAPVCADSKGNKAEDTIGDLVVHSCGDKKTECGSDCSLMKYIDPTDSTKKGTTVIGGQSYSCNTGNCECNSDGYKKCLLDPNDPTSNVCYDSDKSYCTCKPDGTCQVKICDQASICWQDDKKRSSCCPGIKDGTATCCNGNCCPKINGENRCKKNKDGVEMCCGVDDIVIGDNDSAMCCSKSRVFCKKGGKVIWSVKDTPSCPVGDTLECCGNNLCITNGVSSCCTTSKGDGACGTPAICTVEKDSLYKNIKDGPLFNKCIGVIKSACEDGDTNCVPACVSDHDIYSSSFKTDMCPVGEKMKGVTYSSDCTSSSECVGFTNTNKCVNFTKDKEWVPGICIANAPQAYEGECLVGCGDEDTSEIHCPVGKDGGNSACMLDTTTTPHSNFCFDSTVDFENGTEWPANIPNVSGGVGRPKWGQTYPTTKDGHCNVGIIKCDPAKTNNNCPSYKNIDGLTTSQLDCVTQKSGGGLCMAKPEQSLNKKGKTPFFCRVNYELPDNEGYHYGSSLKDMSFLGNNKAETVSHLEDCTSDVFGKMNKDGVTNSVETCGGEASPTSISFPFFTAGSPYEGPGQNLKDWTGNKYAWDCGENSICHKGSSGGSDAVQWGEIVENGAENLNDKSWSTYHRRQWTSKNGTRDKCISQANSVDNTSNDLQLARITWDGATCKAEYDPREGIKDGICDGTSNPENCISNLTNGSVKAISGLMCNQDTLPSLIGLTSNSSSGPDSTSSSVFSCTPNLVSTSQCQTNTNIAACDGGDGDTTYCECNGNGQCGGSNICQCKPGWGSHGSSCQYCADGYHSEGSGYTYTMADGKSTTIDTNCVKNEIKLPWSCKQTFDGNNGKSNGTGMTRSCSQDSDGIYTTEEACKDVCKGNVGSSCDANDTSSNDWCGACAAIDNDCTNACNTFDRPTYYNGVGIGNIKDTHMDFVNDDTQYWTKDIPTLNCWSKACSCGPKDVKYDTDPVQSCIDNDQYWCYKDQTCYSHGASPTGCPGASNCVSSSGGCECTSVSDTSCGRLPTPVIYP